MKFIYLSENKQYVLENDRVVKKDLSYEKGLVSACIGYKNILNITFKLPRDIEEDMLEIEAEKYVYNEGTLDYNKEYKINYIFKPYEDYYMVEAYAIQTDKLEKEFEKYLKIFKYIDFISAKPFVFEAYYDIASVIPKYDVFLYIDNNESFLSCFANGEFVFVKSLSRIESLAKQLDKTTDETIKILNEKGLIKENYEDEETFNIIESFFSQFFMKVNNLINYSVSYYSLPKIERIFFYSSFDINGLFDRYEEFWKLSGVEFKKYEINSDYDAFDYTAVFFNAKNIEKEFLNFSIFPRPVSFYKTRTGILILMLALGFLLISADAYLKYEKLMQQENEIAKLEANIKRHDKERKMLKKAIKRYESQLKSLTIENSGLKNQISDISDKVLFLKEIQTSSKCYNQIQDVLKELKKYDLKLISFNKNSNHTDLILITDFKNASSIANFMKNISKYGYKNISSTKILNKNGIYISKVSYDE